MNSSLVARPVKSDPPADPHAENPSLSEEDQRELEAARREGRLPKTSAVRAADAAMDEYSDAFAKLAR